MYKLCDSNIKSILRMVSVLTNVSVPKKKKNVQIYLQVQEMNHIK